MSEWSVNVIGLTDSCLVTQSTSFCVFVFSDLRRRVCRSTSSRQKPFQNHKPNNADKDWKAFGTAL